MCGGAHLSKASRIIWSTLLPAGTFLFMASFAVMLFFWAVYFQPETHHVPIDQVKIIIAGACGGHKDGVCPGLRRVH